MGKYGSLSSKSSISGPTTFVIGIMLGIWPTIALVNIWKARKTHDIN